MSSRTIAWAVVKVGTVSPWEDELQVPTAVRTDDDERQKKTQRRGSNSVIGDPRRSVLWLGFLSNSLMILHQPHQDPTRA